MCRKFIYCIYTDLTDYHAPPEGGGGTALEIFKHKIFCIYSGHRLEPHLAKIWKFGFFINRPKIFWGASMALVLIGDKFNL